MDFVGSGHRWLIGNRATVESNRPCTTRTSTDSWKLVPWSWRGRIRGNSCRPVLAHPYDERPKTSRDANVRAGGRRTAQSSETIGTRLPSPLRGLRALLFTGLRSGTRAREYQWFASIGSKVAGQRSGPLNWPSAARFADRFMENRPRCLSFLLIFRGERLRPGRARPILNAAALRSQVGGYAAEAGCCLDEPPGSTEQHGLPEFESSIGSATWITHRTARRNHIQIPPAGLP